MKIEEIEDAWRQDSIISESNLGSEALKIPRLHSKWYEILLQEKRIQYSLMARLDQLEINLESFFAKTMTEEERIELNLPPFSDKKYLKPDIPKAVSQYPDVINLKLKIAVQSDKVEFVKDILKQIHGRSFIIKDAIEYAKFSAGGY